MFCFFFSKRFLFRSQQLCGGLDDCEIISEIPDCSDIIQNNFDTDASDETTNRNFYTIVKRDTHRTQFSQSRNSATMRIKVYTKISKGLGLWNQSLSRAENMDIVREELKTYETNERLRNQLYALRINVKHLNLEENLLCRSGSVLKRNNCGKCCSMRFILDHMEPIECRLNVEWFDCLIVDACVQ